MASLSFAAKPTVFVSYSHADETHRKKVHTLVSLLKSKGIPVILDAEKPYEVSWADWNINKGFAPGTKVVVAGDPVYVRNSEMREDSNKGQGQGVWNEWQKIQTRIYERQNEGNWLIPIFFKGGSARSHLPESLRAWTYYVIDPAVEDSEFDKFYQCIWDRPSFTTGLVNPEVELPNPTRVASGGPSSQMSNHRLYIALRTEHMVGREAEMTALIEGLLEFRQGLIYGGPGEGKSTLAMAVGTEIWNRGKCPGGAFEVDMAGVKREGLREHVADQLLPLLLSTLDDGGKGQGSWNNLLHCLRLRNEGFLVIFENCEEALHEGADREGFLECIEKLHQIPGALILVTCREALVLQTASSALQLNKLPEACARELLQSVSGAEVQMSAQQLDELAIVICDCNAFALVMIGSFLKLKRFSVEAALEDGLGVIRESRLDTPAKRIHKLVSFYLTKFLAPDQMAALAKLSIFRGSFSPEGAVFVLQGSGHKRATRRLASWQFWRGLIFPTHTPKELGILPDLDEMVALSVLRALGPETRYSMHLLVREVAHSSADGVALLESQERFVHWMLTRVGADLQSLTPDQGEHPDPQKAAALVAMEALNFQEVLKYAPKFSGIHGDMNAVGLTFYQLGQYAQSVAVFTVMRRILERDLGSEHPHTLVAMSNLALSLGSMGEYSNAAGIKRKVLELSTKVLGPEHPETLIAMSNLASSLHSMGEYSSAAELASEVVVMLTGKLGQEDPVTLIAVDMLAGCLLSLGEYSEAAQIMREALETKTRVLGEEHTSTFVSMNNLAGSLKSQGDYLEAAEIERKCLELRIRVFGPEHPDTLRAQANLAESLRYLGEYSEAARLELEVFELSTKVLGPEHPYTLKAMVDVAESYRNVGEYSEAVRLGQKALELTTKILGPEHPNTLGTMANLGVTLSSLGNFLEASEIARKVLEVRNRVLGSEHPDTLKAMANLASCLVNLGEFSEAARIEENLLESSSRVLGPEHPYTLKMMANHVVSLKFLGEYSEARRRGREVLEATTRVLGPEHPDTLQAMAKLASVVWRLGDHSEAVGIEREVLELSTNILGIDHPNTLAAMSSLVDCLGLMGVPEIFESVRIGRDVADRRTRVLGPENLDTLETKFVLALSLGSLGEHAEAVQMLRHVLELRTRVLGLEHPDTLLTMENLAINLASLGNCPEAFRLLRELVKIRVSVLGPQHPVTLNSMENLDKCIESLLA